VLHAHLLACRQRELPPVPQPAGVVSGTEIVFAPRSLRLDDAAADTLASHPGTHDLPHAGTGFAPGDPVCTVTACGPDPDSVKIALARQREGVLHKLESVR
jgi:predicted ATP-grasp superfamily ATP-dependent carboligase